MPEEDRTNDDGFPNQGARRNVSYLRVGRHLRAIGRRSWHVDLPAREREAVMSTFSIATPEPSERHLTGGTLFLLAGLAALGALATNIILPAFPRIGASLGVSSQELGLTLSSFFVAFAFGQLLAGPLSDHFGRKWLVLGGLAVFVVGSVVSAFADTLALLILGRVIQALGACAASVLSRAIARDLFDGEALGRALALTMIAGAAAPGFSPLLGSVLDSLFGWRITFLVVAVFGMVLALHYSTAIGETHREDRRTSLAFSAAASAYGRLALDPRFLLPAVSVSLVIGGLYTFFTAAPAILMNELGLTAFQLGLTFATTVLIVFAAGFLAPRLAHRWGQRTIGLIGLIVAVAGSLCLFAFAAAPAFIPFTISIALYLLGMGLINPLGTAIALHPFGRQAGLASALLGFLQMGCAAIGASFASLLPLQPSASLAVIMTTGSMLAILVFLPVAMRRPEADAEP
jgi:MFS transporter, DHA1 family, multidrug resistance protein